MAPDQPAANPLCMIWTLIRRPGSLRITICTLNQGNLILFKLKHSFSTATLLHLTLFWEDTTHLYLRIQKKALIKPCSEFKT